MSSACFDRRFVASASFAAIGPARHPDAAPKARGRVAVGQRQRA
jgi:hypothetical protein